MNTGRSPAAVAGAVAGTLVVGRFVSPRPPRARFDVFDPYVA